MKGIFKLIKWLVVLAVAVGAAVGASYVGARATAGKLLGSHAPFTGRQVELAWQGTERLRGNPRAWIFTYRRSNVPGVASATIYVSLTGELLATAPQDLHARIEAWERARLP